jgi:hypothetical protein
VVWGEVPEPLALSDFLAEIEVSHSTGPLLNEAGLVFRFVDEENFYYFRISGDGYFALDRRLQGEWTTLLGWEPSTWIETGERAANLVAVLAEGESFTFLINDEWVATVEDDALARGDLRPAAGTFDEGGVQVAFDDLYLWDLALTSAPPATPEAVTQTNTPVVEPNTATPAPTALPTEDIGSIEVGSADIEAQLADLRSREPLFSDDFRSPQSGWPTFTEADYSIAYADRALLFTNNKTQWSAWSFNEQIAQPAPTSFLLEVDAEHIAGPTNLGYGVIFGYQDTEHYYRFLISGDGSFSLQHIGGTAPLPWTPSAALRSGEGASNRLGLWVDASTVTLLINDQVVGQATLEATPGGGIGLTASTADVAGLAVAFDNFDLWRP